ncbi:hypothetical protein V865_000087 [Kwoniella europaea PYCC6329]|uniref:Pectate lyase n=1 Tax=Kwoniella europaea PYCC6329 TaxID=1423913 RepID=A0AAX4K7A9_9TREE
MHFVGVADAQGSSGLEQINTKVVKVSDDTLGTSRGSTSITELNWSMESTSTGIDCSSATRYVRGHDSV